MIKLVLTVKLSVNAASCINKNWKSSFQNLIQGGGGEEREREREIQLLQEDSNLKSDCNTVSTSEETVRRDIKFSLLEDKSNEWETVSTKIIKKVNSEQPLSIPTCINRYTVLDNF
jgi:membrane-associated HD superfamily phosphohydrolase